MADSRNREYREFKKMKIWEEKKSRNKSIMLYARMVYMAYSSHPNNYWAWDCYKETSEENIEVAKLQSVCWLNMKGQFKTSELTAGVVYEIAYVVKLSNGAYGWELPIKLCLKLPNGKEQRRQYSLLDRARGEWIELSGGSFKAEEGETREGFLELDEHGGHWKGGLILKGILIRPKNRENP